MGGTISFESTLGKGSVFRIDLPLELVSETEVTGLQNTLTSGGVAGLAPEHAGQAYRVLIAEDHYDNRILLSDLMTGLGLEVSEVENGEQCVKRFQEFRPHFIWMDHLMPGMDGLEATKRIRKLPGGRDVKIVVVTASVFKEQQKEILAGGADDIVGKPFRFDEIYNCLAQQLGLKYVYRTDSTTSGDETAPCVLTPAMLAVLSGKLRDNLRNTLESLDGESIDALIGEISEIDAELARVLLRYTTNFDYQAILDVLAGEE
jgi:CheY-like chemotaxis protein